MVALTNFEIEDICKQMGLPIVGVFSKDQLPEKRFVGSYYVNLEDADDGGGTHWVFMRIFPDKKAIYMDSFGVLAPIEIKDFLKPFRPYATNNRHFIPVPPRRRSHPQGGCRPTDAHTLREGAAAPTLSPWRVPPRRRSSSASVPPRRRSPSASVLLRRRSP